MTKKYNKFFYLAFICGIFTIYKTGAMHYRENILASFDETLSAMARQEKELFASIAQKAKSALNEFLTKYDKGEYTQAKQSISVLADLYPKLCILGLISSEDYPIKDFVLFDSISDRVVTLLRGIRDEGSLEDIIQRR